MTRKGKGLQEEGIEKEGGLRSRKGHAGGGGMFGRTSWKKNNRREIEHRKSL